MNHFLVGDALEILRELPSHQIHLTFFDPPYNVGKKYDGYDDNRDDYWEWMRDVLDECRRISERGVVVFIGGRLIPRYWSIMPEAQLVIVHKRARGFKVRGFVHQYHALMCEAEPIEECLTLWNDIRLPGEGYLYHEPRTSNPGQTSLELTKKVIDLFTRPGDSVLDPFVGSGTTALACQELGREWLGIDQSQAYINEATERLTTRSRSRALETSHVGQGLSDKKRGMK